MSTEQDKMIAAKGRTVGLVIAGTIVLWLGAQALGRMMDWPPRFVFLFDFAALAALLWSIVLIFQMWRARQAARDDQQR